MLNTLYFLLAHSVLEYASVIWCSHQVAYIDCINKVQNKYFILVPYQSIYLKPLSERRVKFYI